MTCFFVLQPWRQLLLPWGQRADLASLIVGDMVKVTPSRQMRLQGISFELFLCFAASVSVVSAMAAACGPCVLDCLRHGQGDAESADAFARDFV